MTDLNKLFTLLDKNTKYLTHLNSNSIQTIRSTMHLCVTELAYSFQRIQLDQYSTAIQSIFSIYDSLLNYYNQPKHSQQPQLPLQQQNQLQLEGLQGQFGGSQINLKQSTSNYNLETDQQDLLKAVLSQAKKFDIVIQLKRHEHKIKILHSKSTDTSEDALQIFKTYSNMDMNSKLLQLVEENDESNKYLDFALKGQINHKNRFYSGADQLIQQVEGVLNKKAKSVDQFFKQFHYDRVEPQEDVQFYFEHIHKCFKELQDESFEITLRVFKDYLRRKNKIKQPDVNQQLEDLEKELKLEKKKLAEEFKLRSELTMKMLELDMKKKEMDRLTSQLQELQNIQANSDMELEYLNRMKGKLQQDKDSLQMNIHSIQKNITINKQKYQHDQQTQCNLDALDELKLQIKLQDQKIIQLLREKKKQKEKKKNQEILSTKKTIDAKDIKNQSRVEKSSRNDQDELKEEEQDVINVSVSHSIKTNKSAQKKQISKQVLYRQQTVKIEDNFKEKPATKPYSTTQIQLASILGSQNSIFANKKNDKSHEKVQQRIKTQMDSYHIKMNLGSDSDRNQRMKSEEDQSDSNMSHRQNLINNVSIHQYYLSKDQKLNKNNQPVNRDQQPYKSQGILRQQVNDNAVQRQNKKQLSIRINNEQEQVYFAKLTKVNSSQQTDSIEPNKMINKSVQTEDSLLSKNQDSKSKIQNEKNEKLVQKSIKRLPLNQQSDKKYDVRYIDEASLNSEISNNFLVKTNFKSQSPAQFRETGEWNISEYDTKSIGSNKIRSQNISRMKHVTPNTEDIEKNIEEEMDCFLQRTQTKLGILEDKIEEKIEEKEMNEIKKQKRSESWIKKIYHNLIRTDNKVTKQIELIIRQFLGLQNAQPLQFPQFQRFYTNLINQHQQSCGDYCVHLQRFYQRVGMLHNKAYFNRSQYRLTKSILQPFSKISNRLKTQ